MRGRLYGNAGEDVIFVESSRTVEDMKRSATSFNKPTMANMVEGGKTPLMGNQKLQDVAYKLLAYPLMFLMASIKAIKQVMASWRDNGSTKHLVGQIARSASMLNPYPCPFASPESQHNSVSRHSVAVGALAAC